MVVSAYRFNPAWSIRDPYPTPISDLQIFDLLFRFLIFDPGFSIFDFQSLIF